MQLKTLATRFDGRAWGSLVASLAIGLVALVRVISENEHGWFDGTPLAWVQQIPYNGSFASYLNVQWFKVLYFPAVASFIYVAMCVMIWRKTKVSEETFQRRNGRWYFQTKTTLRCALLCFFGSVGMELWKQSGRGNLVALAGESVPLNHVAHFVSCVIGAIYMHMLTFGVAELQTPKSPTE